MGRVTNGRMCVDPSPHHHPAITQKPGHHSAITHPSPSGIVYCLTQRETEEYAEVLRRHGVRAGHYHAGLAPAERASVQSRWFAGTVDVLCATVAFGMGINKANVRYVG